MKILLLSLHLPVIHIEALSHSRSNITPEYIAARVPVLDSEFTLLASLLCRKEKDGRTDLDQQRA